MNMRTIIRETVATCLTIASFVIVGSLALRGVDGFLADSRQEREMAQMWAEFLEVPKDFRESSTARAAALVRAWETPPNAEQIALLENEIAPRVNHIMATNGQFGNKMWERYLPTVEYQLATRR